MPQPSIESLDALAAAAFGPDARVTGREPIAPWAVMRCTLEGADAPPTVIAKWLREDPNNFRVDPRQIATEQAAFEFLAEVGFSAAPRLH
ncbi:MAG TPA: hypothetical protein VN671_04400, partial [Solirubrobacterales bacterium]|nr:hypothetical protein [Solirubrobacterales bacterium]